MYASTYYAVCRFHDLVSSRECEATSGCCSNEVYVYMNVYMYVWQCVHISFLCEGQGGDEPGQHHGGCALDVVVEASGLVSVALQQAEGIQVTEVFKLNNPHTYTHTTSK